MNVEACESKANIKPILNSAECRCVANDKNLFTFLSGVQFCIQYCAYFQLSFQYCIMFEVNSTSESEIMPQFA